MTRDNFTFNRTPSPDAHLAYLLQHSQPGDPQVLDLLLERHAADLFRLVESLRALRQPERQPPDARASLRLTGDILLQAVDHLDQFWGQASVPVWLYGLALDQLYGRRGRRRLRTAMQHAPPAEPAPGGWQTGREPAVIAALRALPAAPRLAALLRYSHGLDLEAIALLLEVEPSQVHAQLVYARKMLYVTLDLEPGEPCVGWTYEQDPPRARLQSRLDGLLEADPYAENALSAHLNECPGCRAAWRSWGEFETRFSSRLQSHWPAPSAEQRQQLASRVHERLRNPPAARLRLPWRQLSMAVLLVVAVAAVALVFDRIQFAFPDPTSPANPEVLATAQALSAVRQARPEPTAMPTPIEPPAFNRPERQATFAGPNRVWSSQPALSAGGRYLAFASLASYWVPGDNNGVADVFLYDLQTDSVQRISQQADGADGQQASYLPSISYDGQFVAYFSSAANLLPPGSGPPTCADLPGAPGFPYNCGDILLYDSATGETVRITTPADPQADQPLAGEHQAPVLSDTGRYVLFFSTARDFAGLVPGFDETACSQAAAGTCAELYLYDRNLQAMERIPIGRLRSPNGLDDNLSPPSISSNGRYIALTVLPTDAVARRLDSRQALLYDHQSGEFIALDEQPGWPAPDGGSYNPVISSNGRQVAFISEASNLVPDDDNGAADVFLRDLDRGTITRVSVTTAGESGDGPSGIFLADNDQVYERLSISADGRYVAFVSAAGNLVPELQAEDLCWNWEYGSLCAALYLHDSLTGETTLVAEPQHQYIFHQPSLSGDGLRLVYGDDRFGCRGAYPFQVCADLWVYDTQTGERRQLSPGFADQRELQVAQEQLDAAQQALEAGQAARPPDDLPALDAEHLVEKPLAHRRRLRALDVAPNGLLATGSDDDTVILWDALTLEQIDVLQGHRTRVTDVEFSPAGDWLASGSADGTVLIWRTDELARQTPLRAFSTLRSRRIGGIEALAFSPDDRWLVIGSRFGLWVWEREGRTFNLREELSRTDFNVRALDFSPRSSQLTGALLAAGLADGSTALYTLPSGNLLGRLGGQTEPILAVAFDPDGEYLAAGGQSNVVDVWQVNLPRRQPLATHQFRIEHSDWVTDLEFSPSGGTLISASYDDTLRYSDARTGALQMVTDEENWRDFLTVAPAPDGTRLYAGRSSGSLMVFSVPQVNQPQHFYQINVTELGKPPPNGLPASLALERYPPIAHPQNPSLQLAFAHDMQDLANRGFLVPGELPEGLVLIGAHLPPGSPEEALLYYTLLEDRTYRGAVLLRQGPRQAPDFFAPPIPTSALVQPLELSFSPLGAQGETSLVSAEMVRGGWETEAGGFAHWDPQFPTVRLHWTYGQQAYSLEFFDFPEYESSRLHSADLVAMAASMRSVEVLLAQQPVELTYSLPGGQSCDELAALFDLPVEDLLRLNRLGGIDLPGAGCEALPAGQQVLIHLQPQAYLSQDLDCDNTVERLQLLQPAGGSLLGFNLQRQEPTGFYGDTTQVRVEDNLNQVMQPPVLYKRPNSCEWFVAVQVDSLTGGDPLLRLLRWHDGQLQTVLSDSGTLGELYLDDQQLIAETSKLLPTQGTECIVRPHERQRFGWDGEAFVFLDSRVDLEGCPQSDEQAGAAPTAPEPRLLAAADLDCEAPQELLFGVPAPDGPPGQFSTLLVAHRDPLGKTVVSQRLAAADLGGERLGYPAIFRGGRASYRLSAYESSCWYALAVEVFDGPLDEPAAGLQVLGWQEGQLASLAAIPTGLADIEWSVLQAGRARVIYTHEYQQAAGESCQEALVEYRWSGTSFVRLPPLEDGLQRCQPAPDPNRGTFVPPDSDLR